MIRANKSGVDDAEIDRRVDHSCMEVAFLDNGDIAMRDSKDPSGPALVCTPGKWGAFTGGVKDGEFRRS